MEADSAPLQYWSCDSLVSETARPKVSWLMVLRHSNLSCVTLTKP